MNERERERDKRTKRESRKQAAKRCDKASAQRVHCSSGPKSSTSAEEGQAQSKASGGRRTAPRSRTLKGGEGVKVRAKGREKGKELECRKEGSVAAF